MMSATPDFTHMPLPELRAWDIALRAAIAAAEVSGGGEFEAALLADAEGVSVVFTVPIQMTRGAE